MRFEPIEIPPFPPLRPRSGRGPGRRRAVAWTSGGQQEPPPNVPPVPPPDPDLPTPIEEPPNPIPVPPAPEPPPMRMAAIRSA